MVSWLFKWSLELTGSSIILFNYQHYERQQQLIGMYRSARNSFRSVYYLYGIYGDFKEVVRMSRGTDQYVKRVKEFRTKSSESIKELCEINGGVYVRMGQIVSTMTGVLPSSILSPLKNLQKYAPEEIPYESTKTALTESLQKPMKQVFDGFQVKPFKTGLFWQSYRSILL